MGGWEIGLSGCQLPWAPAPRWKGDGHFPNTVSSFFLYSQSSPMTSNINLAHNLGCPNALYNQQHIKSLGPDDNHSFVVTPFSHFNPNSQWKDWCFRGVITAKVLQNMKEGRAELQLITKDPTIKSREWTRSLRWSHSKRLLFCAEAEFLCKVRIRSILALVFGLAAQSSLYKTTASSLTLNYSKEPRK